MSDTKFDVVIIGAGAVGCALARELSRYHLKILVLEASEDVGSGATRANSGIVHGGYAAKNGSLKARFCSSGNSMLQALSRELDFPYQQTGSVVLAFDDEHLDTLERLLENGRANGVHGLEIAGREETLRRISRLNPREIRGGLFCSSAGIVSPYEYAIAMAENSVANGVEILLNSKVTSLEEISGSGSDFISLEAGGREFSTRFVVNAAGAGSEEVAELAATRGTLPFHINPRKGQYIVFRRGSAEGLDTVVFQPPTVRGKGILVTPTTWGNLLIGPDAQEVQSSEDLETDPASLARIIRTARRSIDDFDIKQAIRVFSGSRPASTGGTLLLNGLKILQGFCIWRELNLQGLPRLQPSLMKR